jgi:hypothetical protein
MNWKGNGSGHGLLKISWNLTGRTEEKHEELHDWMKFNPSTS